MATDPERIEDIECRAARCERDHAPPPEVGFGEVMANDRARKSKRPTWREEREARVRKERAAAERQQVRGLMGSSAVHPAHGRAPKVTVKG